MKRRRIAERLEAIPSRVRALEERDPFRAVFGAEKPVGHEYALAPTVSEAALRDLEKRRRVRLPAAYRAFLARVGNGRAGPGYGILPLSRAIEGRKRLNVDFPHGTADARRVMRMRVSGRKPYAFVGKDEGTPGVITLCEDGCGWFTYLVVSGEQRGKVWTAGELGWCPCYFLRGGKPVQHTFLSWYEAWLRSAWRETAPKPFEPPAGRQFNLSGKLVGVLPEALFDSVDVEELTLGANKLRTVPPAIGRLQKLVKLDLGGNQLASLPDAIGDLRALEELHLGHNRLGDLPGAIGKLSRLRVLGLQNNPLRELPATMAACHALRRLALGDTKVERLPTWLSTLGLEELQLNGVRLGDWDELRAFAAGGTLRNLWLSMNKELDRIPDAIFEIESLEYLVLGATAVARIPPAISRLRNLKSIGLANTLVRALPDELLALPALARIVVAGAPVPAEELARARARWPGIELC